MASVIDHQGMEWKKICDEGLGSVWITHDGALRRMYGQQWGPIVWPKCNDNGKLTLFWRGKNVAIEMLIAQAWVSKNEAQVACLIDEREPIVASNIEWKDIDLCVCRGAGRQLSQRTREAYVHLKRTNNVTQTSHLMGITEQTVWKYFYDACSFVLKEDKFVSHLLELCKELTPLYLWSFLMAVSIENANIFHDSLKTLIKHVDAGLLLEPEWKVYPHRYANVRVVRLLLHRFRQVLKEPQTSKSDS